MRFRELGGYSALAYLNQFITALLNLLFIKILPLNTLGDIAIAKVWMQVMDYSHLGLRFSLDRYVPVWERQQSNRLMWVCIGVSSLVSGAIISVALTFTDNKILIFTFCIWGYGAAIATILKNFYRASSDPKRMLITYIAYPTIPAVAQTAALYFWGFNIFLAVTVFASLAAVAYVLTEVRSTAADAWINMRESLLSVRSAATTLLIHSIILFFTFSIDRIILNAFTDKNVVGEYSIVLFAFSVILTIPSTIAEFVFPKIIRLTTQEGKIFYPKEIFIMLAPTIVVVLAAYVTAPYLINKFTAYSHLNGKLQIVTLGILPYAVTPILFHVMNALDMRVQLILSACTVLFIYTLALLWGGAHATNKLEFFTIARAFYGYALLAAYWLCLLLRQRKIN